MTLLDVPSGGRIYLDANLYIYLFEGVPAYRQLMAQLAAEIDRREIAVIATELMFVELLPRLWRDGRRDLVAAYLQFMQRTPRITLVPVDRRVILRAVPLRAESRLRSMDALHVATALVHRCGIFLTNDERLNAADHIPVVTLRELAARSQRQPGRREGAPAGS